MSSFVELEREPRNAVLLWPNAQAFTHYQSNERLVTRRKEALLYASAYLRRQIDYDPVKVFTRHMANDHFPMVDQILNDLLTKVKAVKTNLGEAYSIDRKVYSQILGLANKVQEELGKYLLIEGYAVPELPRWGSDRNISHWYLENELEILGTAFRTEVEQFFSLFDQVYNFKDARPRNEVLLSMGSGFKPNKSFLVTRPNSETEIMRMEDTARPLTSTPASRRHSSMYAHNEEGINCLKEGINAHVHDKLPTSRLRDVLINVGDRFSPENSAEPSEHSFSADRNSEKGGGDEEQIRRSFRRPPGPLEGDDPSSDDERGGPNKGSRRPPKIPNHNKLSYKRQNDVPSIQESHFDTKLKPESVPKWDGNTDTLVRWLTKVNDIASISKTVFTQLGRIVPRRFEGAAETWYWSLPDKFRRSAEVDWDTLRNVITDFYMNRKWLDQQKGKAIRAHYREPGYARETPSEYFIRKNELLNNAYSMEDSELIMEIMEGAPPNWNTILTMQLYATTVEFQRAVRYHEDTLMKLNPSNYTPRDRTRDYRANYTRDSNSYTPRTYLVGAYSGMAVPKYPKDDSNVTKKGLTPEEKGARPCRHCGSGKHWDQECKHAYKAERKARVNKIMASPEQSEAQEAYDNLYYSLSPSDDDEEEASDSGKEEEVI
ncbi:hypothetical protein CPB84DRAFT_1903283 [Gymnopilus junonius]|uniref:Uncharacterized protein n=1 Tax=Gymnopilus junonius TaxID=109634 RepID=A0A9P5NTI3_GYMJU|nr:hypothetical protein CPB84DRAFT_1903283 [Gymnopilus junonius]